MQGGGGVCIKTHECILTLPPPQKVAGKTALHYACWKCSNEDFVNELLSAGATVDVPDQEGGVQKVDWRQALQDHLASIQQPDGTWVNGKNGRWMENLPLLCTCYAMAALEHCK